MARRQRSLTGKGVLVTEEPDEPEVTGDDEPAVMTRNTTWINYSRGVWPAYLFLVFMFRFLLYFFFRMKAPLAWTLTVLMHAICTFMSFHWNKGLPYPDNVQADVGGLTAWEQLNRQPSTLRSRTFLTIVPVALYLIAVTANTDRAAGGNDNFLLFQTIATTIVVVAKLDFMDGVRLFGINQD